MSVRLLAAVLMNILTLGAAFAACDGREIKEGVLNAPICIPAEPKRIVVLDPLFTVGMLQELGVPVAGVAFLGIQDDGIRAAVEKGGATDLGNPFEPSIEQIVALKPDLILGASYLNAPVFDKVSQIAPTAMIETTDWKAHLRLLADMVGKRKEADDSLRGYEERAAKIKARMIDKTLSAVRLATGRFQVYLDGPGAYAPYAVLREAGVKRSAYETTTDNEMLKRPTLEELSALDGDVLFYVIVTGLEQGGPDDALEKETLANPLWQMLPAVQAGHAYRVARSTWMGFHGVGSAHRVLDDVERYLLTPQ